MPAPAAIPGISPAGFSPAVIPAASITASAGSVGGEVYATIAGVVLALDDPWNEPNPTWTRVDEVATYWSVDRGRQFELDKTNTGLASVSFVDSQGLFDPTNTASPYYGKLGPRTQAAIALYDPVADAWTTVFRGFVEKVTPNVYVTETLVMTTLDLVDGFDILQKEELTADDGDPAFRPLDSEGTTFYPAQNVDVRINAVLDNVGWSAVMRNVFSGNVLLRRTVYSPGESALTAIQDAADGEFPGVGNAFMSKVGKVAFRGRDARFKPENYPQFVNTWTIGDLNAAASGAAPISSLDFNLDESRIYNSVTAYPQGIASDAIDAQLVTDTASINLYGRASETFPDLLTKKGLLTGNNAKAETKLFATYWVENLKSPRTRVDGVELRSLPLGSAYASQSWAFICGVEIGDLVTLKTTHPESGGFNEQFFVEGIHYQAEPMNATHLDVTVTLDLSPKSAYSTNPFG